MQLSRRTFLMATAGATASAVAGCSSGSGSTDKSNSTSIEKVNYSTSFGTFGREGYVYVAKDKGFFTDAGLDVSITAGNGTGSDLTELVSGKIDFVPVDFTGSMILLGTGKARGFKAVAAIHQHTPACVLTLEGRGITSPKDLEGHSVGDVPGGTTLLMFPTYAKLAGIDDAKIKHINTTTQQEPAQLASGFMDAIGAFTFAAPTMEKAAQGKKSVILPYSDYLTDLYGNMLVTSDKIAQQKPDLVKKFVGALLKGLQYAVEHPDEAGQILHKNVPAQNADVAAAELTLMKPFVTATPVGALDEQRVARGIAIMQGANAVPAGITPSQFIDFNLAPKA
jgi:NitT/TauT family transport system substrate-binding protein